jgi:hypothetical protein
MTQLLPAPASCLESIREIRNQDGRLLIRDTYPMIELRGGKKEGSESWGHGSACGREIPRWVALSVSSHVRMGRECET